MRKHYHEKLYEHDCKYCTYIDTDDKYDYYICVPKKKSNPTIIARFGSSPEEYYSMDMSTVIGWLLKGTGKDNPLVECLKLAIGNDLLRIEYKVEKCKSYWED